MPVLSLISRETDDDGFVKNERWVSERGTEFTIRPTAIGLFEIIMHGGGAVPEMCRGSWTSNLRARQVLSQYIASTDRNGYAEYPEKTAAAKPKAKTRSNGTGEI